MVPQAGAVQACCDHAVNKRDMPVGPVAERYSCNPKAATEGSLSLLMEKRAQLQSCELEHRTRAVDI